MNEAVKDFKKSMQKIADEGGTTISMSFNGEEHVIAAPKDVMEDVGAIINQKPNLKPLHLACSTDELRQNLQLIKIRNNHATATNGTILVRIDLTLNTDFDIEVLALLNGKNIHREVYKEIHKCDSVQFFEDQIDCWKNGIKKTFYYSDSDGELWDDNHIIQQIKDAGEEPKRLVTYNPEYINIISKIFQEGTLHFSFSKGNAGTFVFPREDSGMFAVLMPYNAEGVNRYFFL